MLEVSPLIIIICSIEFCAKGTLADVLVNPDIDLSWIFRFSLINDLLEGSYIKTPLE
jgi:hypothetical protein